MPSVRVPFYHFAPEMFSPGIALLAPTAIAPPDRLHLRYSSVLQPHPSFWEALTQSCNISPLVEKYFGFAFYSPRRFTDAVAADRAAGVRQQWLLVCEWLFASGYSSRLTIPCG
jgi:hypothetical protein